MLSSEVKGDVVYIFGVVVHDKQLKTESTTAVSFVVFSVLLIILNVWSDVGLML